MVRLYSDMIGRWFVQTQQQTLGKMTLTAFQQHIHQFVQRIRGSLDLEPDPTDAILHRRTLIAWIHEQTLRLREEKDKEKKSENIFTGILAMTGISQPNKKLIESEAATEWVKNAVTAKQISFEQAELETLELPSEISEALRKLNKVKVPEHYGTVSGPLMTNFYLRTREDFDGCLRRGCINDLRFTSLGSDFNCVVKYQRMLVEQLFNRLFHREGELSMVIKIEVEKESLDRSIEVFCLVEDLRHKLTGTCRLLKELRLEENTQELFLFEGEKKVYVDDMSVFTSLLTQMLILPFQTIISDYAVEVQDGRGRLVKLHYGETANDLSSYIKQHPSLRNPLFFFYNFIKSHQFSAAAVREGMQPRQLYGNFYEILSMLMGWLRNDFSFRFGGGSGARVSSLGLDESLVRALWGLFHEVMIVPNWVQEVIAPIRPAVSLLEVARKVHPIFGDMLKVQKESYEQHQKFLLALPIENYLTLNVSKITIQKYKDTFLNISSVPFTNYARKHPFDPLFSNALKNYNITNAHIYESLYFLNFIARNNPNAFKEGTALHPSWRNRKLWKEIIKLRNKEDQDLPYLSINLDILAFQLDFDPLEDSQHPFASIRHDEENDELFQRIQILIAILKGRYQRKCSEYLSFLIEKAFRYKKYRVVEFLIKKGVHINNYEDIFAVHKEYSQIANTRDSKFQRQEERAKLKQLMKDREPQMYRRYQWEQLLGVHLRQHGEYQHLAILKTIRRGSFYVDRDIYSHLTSNSSMSNTISRSDYMFSVNRTIAKLDIFGADAYIQLTEYPLLRYFYSFFLGRLQKGYLALNFCGFFAQDGKLGHLMECIPQCFNFQKGLTTHTEIQLKNFTNPDDISQAILISMMLMPTSVLLKNIIVSPLISGESEGDRGDRKSLFIVDFHDFYQKNGFQSSGGTTSLKVRNSLFLFDEMGNTISQKLMKKYASINVLQIVNGVFKDCAAFISEVNALRPKNTKIPEDQQQLHTLIFQNGFAEVLAERMFKIRNALQKCLRNKAHIDPFELLEILDPPLSYYYREIIQTTPRLLERERILLDDSFKKSLIINDRLINFLPNAYYVEEVRDSFPNHYRRFGFQGPTENLAALDRNILKFMVYSQKIGELKDYGHETIQYFIRNIDLSVYLKEEREALVGRMQDYSKEYLTNEKNCLPLSVVRINNMDSIKEKSLRFSDERLQELIFEDARCSQGEFNALLRKYHSMRNLILRALGGVQRIGESFISTQAMPLRNLKYLSIIGCPEITTIDLRCEQLEHVTLRRNKSLSEIYLLSKRFKNMDCSECSRLRLENIAIYILKRINLLICQHSCDGDVKRLQDGNYSTFLTRILRYLFNRFEESNTYKLELIITLVKLDLVDGALFGFKGSLSSKSYLTVVAKLGKELLTLVQTQLFDLFLKNSLVELLNIDELLKIESFSLRSIEGYLVKQMKLREEGGLQPFRKQFSGMVFKEFIKIPLFYNQHIEFVKLLVRYIDVEKVFKLHLSLSPDISLADYVDIIGTLTRKQNLERLEVTFENSYISKDLLVFLFSLECEKSKISRMDFINCDIRAESGVVLHDQAFVKTVTFNGCSIQAINFIAFFHNLVVLKVDNCKFMQPAPEIYETIGQLKSLMSLSLVKLKPNLPNQQLCLSEFFLSVQGLPKLQELDFSSNSLNEEELLYFSSQLHKIRIYQLTLHNFHDSALQEAYIDDFLFHQHLKIINIDFKSNGPLLQSFINSISRNKSILRVNLKTDADVQSHFFEKLKDNRVLEGLHSNHPLPNWLKNHIISNPKAKSAVYQYEAFEPSLNSVGKTQDFYRIGLSLDGGGVRGLLLATELDYLSTKVGKPLHKIFDCVGGTSIGGICALASTGTHDGIHPVCSTSDLIDIFQLYGNKIFKKSSFGHITNLFQNKYDVMSFEELLNGYFKMTKLSDVLTETNVVVTAVNRLTNQDVIFRSINAIFDRNQDFYMRDIARGTSAAPTYFPSAEIKNINATQRYSLIDGGVGLNNPSKLVIDDIIKITQNEAHKKNYFLLSLGTGRLINEAIPSNAGIKDLAPIIDSFTESANFFIEKDLAENYKGHFLRVSPLINMHRKDGELDNTSPEILKVYRDTGLQSAEEYFTNTIAFGKYKNQSLVEWLQENTDRKYEA